MLVFVSLFPIILLDLSPSNPPPTTTTTTITNVTTTTTMGRDSVVGIVTRYGLDSPRIESWWGQDFPHPSRLARVPSQPPVQWVLGLFWG